MKLTKRIQKKLIGGWGPPKDHQMEFMQDGPNSYYNDTETATLWMIVDGKWMKSYGQEMLENSKFDNRDATLLEIRQTIEYGEFELAKKMLSENSDYNIVFYSDDSDEIITASENIDYVILNWIYKKRKLGFEFFIKLMWAFTDQYREGLIEDLELTQEQFAEIVKTTYLTLEETKWLKSKGFFLTREMILDGVADYDFVKKEDRAFYFAYQIFNDQIHFEYEFDRLRKVEKCKIKKELDNQHKRELSEYEFTQFLIKKGFPIKFFPIWFLPENIHGHQIIKNIYGLLPNNEENIKIFLLQVPFTKEDIKNGLKKYESSFIVDVLLIKWVELELRPEGIGSKLLQYVNSFTPKKNKRKSL